MKPNFILFIGFYLLVVSSSLFGQTNEEEKKAIIKVINQAYLGGMFNNEDSKEMLKGFHEKCIFQSPHGEELETSNLQETISMLDKWKLQRKDWNNKATAQLKIVDMEGAGALVRSDIFYDGEPQSTDFLSLVKFSDGWKITFLLHDLISFEQEIARHERINSKRMPPKQVLDSIGLHTGMTIGEIGAGKGRYTVHLARRVGNTGKVYANDINQSHLDFLKKRCSKSTITNVKYILGKEDNPLFPKEKLDMVITVWVYHHLTKPVEILENIKSHLKSDGKVVIIDPDPEKERDSDRPTTNERIIKEADEAGYRVVKMLDFLPMDHIYILEPK